MRTHRTEYIPEWAINYIENGEAGDLTHEDIEMVDNFTDQLSRVVDFDWDFENTKFVGSPIFGLGCDCVKTKITETW